MTIAFFDKRNLSKASWPGNEEGCYAHHFLPPMIEQGAHLFFSNIRATIEAVKIDDMILPLTINHSEHQNAYTSSPLTQYIDYGAAQLTSVSNPLLRIAGRLPIALLRSLFQKGQIDKVVGINNWLLSTNLWSKISDEQLDSLMQILFERFPDHALVFRSINPVTTPSLFSFFQKPPFLLIPTRPVYLLDTQNPSKLKARMWISDQKLLKKTPYTTLSHEEIPFESADRLLSLYNALNLDKYSALNPQYSLAFVQHALRTKILEFVALRRKGRIDGCVGYFSRNGVMTSPFFGYDTSLPKKLGLYRLISTLLTLKAKERGELLHQSAGASSFKTLRRAERTMEYMAVAMDHLPLWRRLPWQLLQGMMIQIGIPVMQHLRV